MGLKAWEKVRIQTTDGEKDAIAPVIISASRATDVPAFYPEWFMNRLKAGYVKWVNPFNHKEQYVSFEKTRAVVFWTKNARPMFKYLDALDSQGINYYFTFTVNDYFHEGLEPRLPALEDRLETFRELSQRIGRGRVVWRFDPLLLGNSLTIGKLLERVRGVGDNLAGYTDKLVISFADISAYGRVRRNLENDNSGFRELTAEECYEAASVIRTLAAKWGMVVAACSEKINLEEHGITRNSCVDAALLAREFKHDGQLMGFLGGKEGLPKDKGQRKECGCIMSKDIGQYNTCGHMCAYCYANNSPRCAEANMKRHDARRESIL